MPRVKPASAIAEKWARVTPARQEDYAAGVRDPNVNWQAPTVAAAPAYEQGVQEAMTAGRFQRGVQQTGDQRWREKVTTKGEARWAPGVRAATPDMQAAIEPFVQAIERTNLPPRAPRGDPRNMERAAQMAAALHRARVQRS